MSDAQAPSLPSALWKQLSSERKRQAADAFWRDDNAHAEHAEAIVAIAQRIKFRPKSVIALPVEKKSHYLMSLPTFSELVAARLLVSYHLVEQRPMMAAFLDALGIKHDEGLIAEEDLEPPSAERLKAAADTIRASCPAQDVELYLSTLIWQDPDTWGGLSETVQSAVGE